MVPSTIFSAVSVRREVVILISLLFAISDVVAILTILSLTLSTSKSQSALLTFFFSRLAPFVANRIFRRREDVSLRFPTSAYPPEPAIHPNARSTRTRCPTFASVYRDLLLVVQVTGRDIVITIGFGFGVGRAEESVAIVISGRVGQLAVIGLEVSDLRHGERRIATGYSVLPG